MRSGNDASKHAGSISTADMHHDDDDAVSDHSSTQLSTAFRASFSELVKSKSLHLSAERRNMDALSRESVENVTDARVPEQCSCKSAQNARV